MSLLVSISLRGKKSLFPCFFFWKEVVSEIAQCAGGHECLTLLTLNYAMRHHCTCPSVCDCKFGNPRRKPTLNLNIQTFEIHSTDLCVYELNLLAPELFFLILAPLVYKMWIIQEPNKLELWNKLHFEGKKKGEYIPCLKYSVPIFVE